MGIFNKAVNAIRGGKSTDGNHEIKNDNVLGHTSNDVPSPTNPGQWISIRSVPVVHDPRYFSKQEADVLWAARKQSTQGKEQAKRAFKHLAKIEGNDSEVHKAHKKYIGKVADAELVKLSANAKLARHFHALRPEYAQLGQGLANSEARASERVQGIQAKIRGSF
jgi:hypothetical protein